MGMEMETQIFRRRDQLKALFLQLTTLAVQAQLPLFHQHLQDLTTLTAVHRQVNFQQLPSVNQAPASLRPVPIPVHQASRPMTFTPSKILSQQPIRQTIETLRPVIYLKLFLPDLQIRTSQRPLLTITKTHHKYL